MLDVLLGWACSLAVLRPDREQPEQPAIKDHKKTTVTSRPVLIALLFNPADLGHYLDQNSLVLSFVVRAIPADTSGS